MLFKALESVAGKVCFGAGELVELTDKVIIEDLVNAGYIKPVESEGKAKTETQTIKGEAQADVTEATEVKTAKRGRKPKTSEG